MYPFFLLSHLAILTVKHGQDLENKLVKECLQAQVPKLFPWMGVDQFGKGVDTGVKFMGCIAMQTGFQTRWGKERYVDLSCKLSTPGN